MRIEHNIILEKKGKQSYLPVFLEFEEKLTKEEIEGLKDSASKFIISLYLSGNLQRYENNVLLEAKKEIYGKVKSEKELEKMKPIKVITYKVIFRE